MSHLTSDENFSRWIFPTKLQYMIKHTSNHDYKMSENIKTHSRVSAGKKTKDSQYTNVLFTTTIKSPNSTFCISKTTKPISIQFIQLLYIHYKVVFKQHFCVTINFVVMPTGCSISAVDLKFFPNTNMLLKVDFLNQACTTFGCTRLVSWNCLDSHIGMCGCVSVCPPPRTLLTSGVIWCDIGRVRLVKQISRLFPAFNYFIWHLPLINGWAWPY